MRRPPPHRGLRGATARPAGKGRGGGTLGNAAPGRARTPARRRLPRGFKRPRRNRQPAPAPPPAPPSPPAPVPSRPAGRRRGPCLAPPRPALHGEGACLLCFPPHPPSSSPPPHRAPGPPGSGRTLARLPCLGGSGAGGAPPPGRSALPGPPFLRGTRLRLRRQAGGDQGHAGRHHRRFGAPQLRLFLSPRPCFKALTACAAVPPDMGRQPQGRSRGWCRAGPALGRWAGAPPGLAEGRGAHLAPVFPPFFGGGQTPG